MSKVWVMDNLKIYNMARYSSKDLLGAYEGQLQPVAPTSMQQPAEAPVESGQRPNPFNPFTDKPEDLQARQSRAAKFTGGEKLALGIGQTLAQRGNTKRLNETQSQQFELQGRLIQTIKAKKAKGEDTSRLEKALADLTGSVKETGDGAEAMLNPNNLTNREVIGSGLQLAANFIPGVGRTGSLAKRVGAGAATGYVFDVGAKLQDTENPDSKDFVPGVGTAVGAALPIAGNVLKGVFGKSAQILEKENLRLSPKDRAMLKKDGDSLVTYLTKKKIVGGPSVRLEKVESLYDDMEKKVQETIKTSGVKYNKSKLIEELKLIPEKVSDDPELQSEVSNRVGKLIEYVNKTYDVEIPATSVNNLKRTFAKKAFSRNTDEVINEARYYIADELRTKLVNDVQPLKTLNKEYGKIILARKLLEKAVGRNQLGFTGKIISSAAGALAGGAIGGPAGATLGVVAGPSAGKLLAGTATRSRVGAGLQTLNELLSKQSGPNIAIPRDVLMNLIQSFRQ